MSLKKLSGDGIVSLTISFHGAHNLAAEKYRFIFFFFFFEEGDLVEQLETAKTTVLSESYVYLGRLDSSHCNGDTI